MTIDKKTKYKVVSTVDGAQVEVASFDYMTEAQIFIINVERALGKPMGLSVLIR